MLQKILRNNLTHIVLMATLTSVLFSFVSHHPDKTQVPSSQTMMTAPYHPATYETNETPKLFHNYII